MKLSDSEKQKFIALAQDTHDPELWTENDLLALRAADEEFERAQREECSFAAARAFRRNGNAAADSISKSRSELLALRRVR